MTAPLLQRLWEALQGLDQIPFRNRTRSYLRSEWKNIVRYTDEFLRVYVADLDGELTEDTTDAVASHLRKHRRDRRSSNRDMPDDSTVVRGIYSKDVSTIVLADSRYHEPPVESILVAIGYTYNRGTAKALSQGIGTFPHITRIYYTVIQPRGHGELLTVRNGRNGKANGNRRDTAVPEAEAIETGSQTPTA